MLDYKQWELKGMGSFEMMKIMQTKVLNVQIQATLLKMSRTRKKSESKSKSTLTETEKVLSLVLKKIVMRNVSANGLSNKLPKIKDTSISKLFGVIELKAIQAVQTSKSKIHNESSNSIFKSKDKIKRK